MPSVTLSTGCVHYTERGKGEPLVLLHANPGDSRDFEAVIPELGKRYRVLAIDWPGYGQSVMPHSPGAASVSLYYQVLREFITALALPPAYYLGNSVGGNVAARLACESPFLVRGLVLVSPGGFTPHNLVTRMFCRLQSSRFSLSPALWARLYLRVRNSTTQTMLLRAASTQAEPETIRLNRAMWRSFASPESDLRELAKQIVAPTLLIFGKHDPAIPAHKDGKVAAERIAASKFVVLPCGHAAFAEKPDQFLAELLAFLKEVT